MIKDELKIWFAGIPDGQKTQAVMRLSLAMGTTPPTLRATMNGDRSPTEDEAAIIRAHIGPGKTKKRRKP
jgi:hypothetical protein